MVPFVEHINWRGVTARLVALVLDGLEFFGPSNDQKICLFWSLTSRKSTRTVEHPQIIAKCAQKKNQQQMTKNNKKHKMTKTIPKDKMTNYVWHLKLEGPVAGIGLHTNFWNFQTMVKYPSYNRGRCTSKSWYIYLTWPATISPFWRRCWTSTIYQKHWLYPSLPVTFMILYDDSDG